MASYSFANDNQIPGFTSTYDSGFKPFSNWNLGFNSNSSPTTVDLGTNGFNVPVPTLGGSQSSSILGGSGGGMDWGGILGAGVSLFGALQQAKLAKQQMEMQRKAYQDQYKIAAANYGATKGTLEDQARRRAISGMAQQYVPLGNGVNWGEMSNYFTEHADRADIAGQAAKEALGIPVLGESAFGAHPNDMTQGTTLNNIPDYNRPVTNPYASLATYSATGDALDVPPPSLQQSATTTTQTASTSEVKK